MELKSSIFNNNEFIPQKYTCDGENINPPLVISDIPEGAKSLVLIMDDPDATGGITFDHWVVWNIPPETTEIRENSLPQGAIQGGTGFGKNEYGGPCPPRGNSPHRYMFKLYALDGEIDLSPAAKKEEVEKSMEGRILARALLVGRYGR